jgi:hypothetical protein
MFFLGSSLTTFSGNGGQATSAGVRQPIVVCSDTTGNMYVDSGSTRICKVDSSGRISTYAGTGFVSAAGDGLQATSATISSTYNCVVDSSANVYLSASGNRAIRVVAFTSKIISKFAGIGSNANKGIGDGGPATSAEMTPISIFLDSVGNMYSTEFSAYRVRKIAAGGNKIITNFAGTDGVNSFTGMGGLATSATFVSYLPSVGGDSSGNIFIGSDNSLLRVDEATNFIDVFAGEL